MEHVPADQSDRPVPRTSGWIKVIAMLGILVGVAIWLAEADHKHHTSTASQPVFAFDPFAPTTPVPVAAVPASDVTCHTTAAITSPTAVLLALSKDRAAGFGTKDPSKRLAYLMCAWGPSVPTTDLQANFYRTDKVEVKDVVGPSAVTSGATYTFTLTTSSGPTRMSATLAVIDGSPVFQSVVFLYNLAG